MGDEQRTVPDDRVDGNALAGPLREVLAVDPTTGVVTCVGCGRRQVLAVLEVYGGGGPGLTGRCTGCHGVVLRVARVRDEVYLDLRGTVALRLGV